MAKAARIHIQWYPKKGGIMDISSEVKAFIDNDDNTGALLITGTWGSGKTWLIKDMSERLNKEKEYAVAIISLFGISSIDSLNQKIKEVYLEQYIKASPKGQQLIQKGGEIIEKIIKVVSKALPDSTKASTIATAVSSAMSLSIYDYINIKNTIFNKKFVLIFDDLERADISMAHLLGVLNDYCENKKINIILVADEEKIMAKTEDKAANVYKEFKEKVIARTIHLNQDYKRLITEFICAYREKYPDYYSFLENNKSILIKVFEESKAKNLRTVKCILSDFRRVYNTWKETGVLIEEMPNVFYSFSAEMYINKLQKEDGEIDESSDLKNYRGIDYHQSRLPSLSMWISKGMWEEEAVKNDIRYRYEQKEYKPFEQILKFDIWSLTEDVVDEGVNTALQMAYEGKLTLQEYEILLIRLAKFSELGHDCKEDYSLLEAGMRKKLSKNIEAEKGVSIGSLFFGNKVKPEAKPLITMLQRFNSLALVRKNKEYLCQFLNGNNDINYAIFQNQPIEEFDDELREIFLNKYTELPNGIKRYWGQAVLIVDYFSLYSSSENKKKTRDNLGIIRDFLIDDSQNNSDFISRNISSDLVKMIDDLLDKKE